ncbi:protein kinase ALK2 KNAG_0C02880 [Huiozyma naganishii CBS 8797]|uniref:non-specific serine/threonine protein kinase n=1 Tax=Huiozyma naganishii (strain ATCC MYA-139 / BCRC 22969 / CBS 8797 / KCTC 17520 / NBRC 10181 / NCYC 3082 / Yp74L-3) TaxID=1071383 RepID=J7S4P3_HUIN7|nr:hypothetical protein KNAG_0C02880 [Kazachstania naganishii CBS 8797]CCK69399.1 hypothetical protein KNAG_0C02880 [Kazachstania naganishii CBS 8797]
MDYEDDSFEDWNTGKGQKFIALVVSDNSDSESRLVQESGPVRQRISSSGTKSRQKLHDEKKSTGKRSQSKTIKSQSSNNSPNANTATPRTSIAGKSEEKKRWSFMSNHSSSSKKRWSSFTLDSNTAKIVASSHSSNNNRLSVVSTSSSSNIDGQSIEGQPLEKASNRSRTHSLKRSSTGSSLRQLLNKIVTSENSELDKENQPLFSSTTSSNASIRTNGSNKGTKFKKSKPSITVTNSDSRQPLKPLRNTLNTVETQNSFRRPSLSSMNTNTSKNSMSMLNSSMDNLSIHTKRPSISSMSSSTSLSKWKFWKRPTQLNNGGNNIHNQEYYQHSQNQRHNPNVIDKQTGKKKLRQKSSLADFHSGTNNDQLSFYSNIDYTGGQQLNGANTTLNKRTSTSSLSLSISSLKHRSSQPNLKHKTSHSSLPKFKNRRQSNTGGDDGSSLLTISSSMNSVHSSHSNGTTNTNNISLPVPNAVSRDKIRAKLKNSASLLSLNSKIPMEKKSYDDNMLNEILDLCTVKCVIEPAEIDSKKHQHLETLSSNHSIQISQHVWRCTSSLDQSQTIICKKIPLLCDFNEMESCLKELKILKLCTGTPGLPFLIQNYIIRSADTNENTLYLFLKDMGDPITEREVKNWSTCLKIFWQCALILYVAETKFQFEHRNLTLDHILIDKNGTITLCDLSKARANYYSNDNVIYTRLDHPAFFQGGRDYLFDIYNSMRSIFIAKNEHWNHFEPGTNLLWLRYLAIMLLTKNKDRTMMGPGRDQLLKLTVLLDMYPAASTKRSNHLFNKRKEIEIKSTGDLMKWK